MKLSASETAALFGLRNVGVPVEHYDSEAIATFHEVLDIAWKWFKSGDVPTDLRTAVEAYPATRSDSSAEPTDCHAIPEIAAAVQSFIMSREAVPGIYVYFDIGAGTNDGVVFNFVNDDGERRVNFYSGKVSPIGIAALLNHLDVKVSNDIDAESLQRLLNLGTDGARAEFGMKIQRHVAGVIMEGKKKDGRNWQEAAIQNPNIERKRIGSLKLLQMKPLVVFLGGGGSRSPWYRERIAATYMDFHHHRADIPPYKLIDVPKPNDLDMGVLRPEEFRRFAIAYGLSIPFGEGPEIALPSRFKNAEPPPEWKPRGVIDYRDSKDVYD